MKFITTKCSLLFCFYFAALFYSFDFSSNVISRVNENDVKCSQLTKKSITCNLTELWSLAKDQAEFQKCHDEKYYSYNLFETEANCLVSCLLCAHKK